MKDYQSQIDELLETAAKHNASDIHISVGRYPTLRIDSRLVPLNKYSIITAETAEGLAGVLIPSEHKEEFLAKKEIDFSYNYKDKVRFRVNVFHQRGFVSVALRIFPPKIKTLKELNLPEILETFVKSAQGFFLVTGPSGQGKSTTLAALIDSMNHSQTKHIITIEDPIEYIFDQDKCLIDQREVGKDTLSFRRALRSVLRQDPDVIMVGEMRDLETISTAITAAETGHLVFATMHTNSASQTIDRIIDSFPIGSKNQIRAQLASSLLGVFSQRLIPIPGGGRIPAFELMVATPAVRSLIRENKVYQLDLVIETSSDNNMVSLNRSLANLVHRGLISMESAEIYSLNKSDLKLLLGR
ncbi:MAG TPA: type IV pilus twitching motility protein PilT [Candidatus Portnoybacteria bacterium]|jgi:twitching motility protein PilT|nr:type IV pilus twitching motility protein PilT [Candidatus Portnoybacteria bacterium]MDD5752378.1 type IV pilus twitching motility protein PilT [Candidatus Portnoybacteria bacterium]HPJ80550.1 type IV pilus twitching motility protein PilT [Candidatus Portnoybacteria bacterium]